MKKLQKTSELMWVFGIIFVALGVAICSKADLGVSMVAAPAFILSEALSHFWSGFSVGVVEYIVQGLMLIALCVIVRKFNWRYLVAFLVAVIYGYTLNFFLWIFSSVEFSAVWLRWVMLIVGDVIVALGVACFFKTYLPLQVYELFVSETSNAFKFNLNKVKTIFDFSLLTLSLILAFTLFGDVTTFNWSTIYYNSFHSIGLGTIVTTIINSQLIKLSSKILDKIFEPTARFATLEKVFSRN